MKTTRLLTNICSSKLPETRDFYVRHFGFEVAYNSDWFINLEQPDTGFEIGILQSGHELLPERYHSPAPRGVYLTFVVERVNQCFERASTAGVVIVQPPEDTFYGQRRCLVLDPNELLIDVSTPASQL